MCRYFKNTKESQLSRAEELVRSEYFKDAGDTENKNKKQWRKKYDATGLGLCGQ